MVIPPVATHRLLALTISGNVKYVLGCYCLVSAACIRELVIIVAPSLLLIVSLPFDGLLRAACFVFNRLDKFSKVVPARVYKTCWLIQ